MKCFVLTLVLCGTALAQSGLIADAKHQKVEYENDQLQAIRIVLPAHEKTAVHTDPGRYEVFLTDAHLRLTYEDGSSKEVHLKAGQSTWSVAVKHSTENLGAVPFEEVVIVPKKSK
jgi:quercetin dioxygenase-like cupin family protein